MFPLLPFSFIISLLLFFFKVFVGIITIFLFKAVTDPNQCVDEVVSDHEKDEKAGYVPGRRFGVPTVRCLDGFWKHLRIGPYYNDVFDIPEIPIGTIIAVISNSILIIIFNAIYSKVSIWLNDYENHQTETIYQDALIFKTASFQFVNSYGALFYIAFIKEPIINKIPNLDIYAICPYIEQSKHRGRSCLNELSIQLFSIFVINMVINSLSTIVIPEILKKMKSKSKKLKSKQKNIINNEIENGEYDNDKNDENDDDDDEEYYDINVDKDGIVRTTKRVKSYVELEFDLGDYDPMMSLFKDYEALLIQFGYATIFTAAFPMAPALAFVNNYYKMKYDLYKHCQLRRRSFPVTAEDIGTWQSIFQIFSIISVLSNCALIIFVGRYLHDYQTWLPFHPLDPSHSHDTNDPNENTNDNTNETADSIQGYKWLLFVLMEHVLLGSKYLIDILINDIPYDVQIQLERQDLITSKLIDDAESDQDDDDDDDDFDDGNRSVGNRSMNPLEYLVDHSIDLFDNEMILNIT